MLNKQDELGRKVTALEQSVTPVQENCLAIELLMLEIFRPPPQQITQSVLRITNC